ncbi:MAG TPA: ATP-binding protein [Anaerolineales bacterium]|nr:ATP-binding protein [Anaerolineales bacterium]
MNQTRQITRAAEFASLAAFRAFIDTVCHNHASIHEQVLYDLKLAVDEACTNIITHGYAEMKPGSIILSLDVQPQQVSMTLTDFGHAFEPSEPEKPDPHAGLENGKTGGFGLYFIYETMDEISYEITEAGNRLKLVKRLQTT